MTDTDQLRAAAELATRLRSQLTSATVLAALAVLWAVLTDDSWADWRADNPEWVAEATAQLEPR